MRTSSSKFIHPRKASRENWEHFWNMSEMKFWVLIKALTVCRCRYQLFNLKYNFLCLLYSVWMRKKEKWAYWNRNIFLQIAIDWIFNYKWIHSQWRWLGMQQKCFQSFFSVALVSINPNVGGGRGEERKVRNCRT